MSGARDGSGVARDSSSVDRSPSDPLGAAVAAFLEDVVDDVIVEVRGDRPSDMSGDVLWLPAEPIRGGDGRVRQFGLRSSAPDRRPVAGPLSELGDLPAAALRALDRLARSDAPEGPVHPSFARALHDAIVAEVLADRLWRRAGHSRQSDPPAALMADVLDYASELAATQYEGQAVTHGVVVATDHLGLVPLSPPVEYPGRLPSRKRTPLLFDGSESVLVVTSSGHVLRGVGVETSLGDGLLSTERQREVMGLDGALTAAASAAFNGIGVLARPDRTVWVFDSGEPLFIRRTTRWKAVALTSFTRRLAEVGRTASLDIADRMARAAVRSSIQGHGALLAIAPDRGAVRDLLARKDRHIPTASDDDTDSVDDDLHRVIASSGPVNAMTIARLARLDGATVVDPTGALLAYGAVVRSGASRGEGARSAAARTLSRNAHVAISVSQDGPITVFHDGQSIFTVL
jgi:DNA integrity scanning protein DisA with diadenylate cyclase activity